MPLKTPIEPYSYYRRGGSLDEPVTEPLSGYLAGKERGGKSVQALEDAWAERFGVRHAIACNSATSGLLAASIVCRPEWADQDIAVPCFTMSATAAAPHLACPDNQLYFMDCDPETYCSTPFNCPTNRVGMIVVTDLFGQAAPLTKWRECADKLGILLIEDAAQAPFAETVDGKLAGTVGDVGVYSLNVHKHLQVGEGGIIVTNNDELASQMRGFINHAECSGHEFVGLNLRMTEMTAAMAHQQLDHANHIISTRIELAHELSDMVDDFWEPPLEEGKHVYYHWAVRVPNRDAVCNFLRAEGIPVRNGYVRPLYHLPAFSDLERPCAVAENAHLELMIFEICSWDPTKEQLNEIREAFKRASDLSMMP